MYRSPLRTEMDSLGANWQKCLGSPIVFDYGESDAQREESFRRLALFDLSPLPRFGLKGSGIQSWIDSNRLDVGVRANIAYVQNDGRVICRLSENELLVLPNVSSPSDPIVSAQTTESWRCYILRRCDSHAWFGVAGERSADMFAKICGVDLSSQHFPDLSIAQTSVARVSAVVLRQDRSKVPFYHLFVDNSFAKYVWSCLQDAAIEFDSRLLGLKAIKGADEP